MNSAQRIWPEGEQFTKPVTLQTNTGPLDVEITFTVPPFEAVVETWQNKDPEKSYPLFRQFLVDWDQEKKLSDTVLMMYLRAYEGASEDIFIAWCDYIKVFLVSSQDKLILANNTTN